MQLVKEYVSPVNILKGLSQCSSYKHSLSVAIGLMNKLEVAKVSVSA